MEGLVNNIDLYMVVRKHVGSISDNKQLCAYLKNTLNIHWTEELSTSLLAFCQKFCNRVSVKWQKSSRTLPNFLKKNEDWLESTIAWPEDVTCAFQQSEAFAINDNVCDDSENVPSVPPISLPEPSTSTAEPSTSYLSPRKPFEQLGDKQKRRRVEHLKKSFSPEEVNAAFLKKLESDGNAEMRKIVEHLINHPEDVNKVKTCISQKKESESYTPEKASAVFISLNLTKWQYINLRDSARELNSSIYPSYYKLKQEKIKCYPPKEDITITEDGATIKLQALLDLTVCRLLEAMEYDLSSTSELKLICKWGFDGASSQSNYKQKADFDDSTVFMASLVPLKLMRTEEVIWENDRPSSTDYCRPIMFKFLKENQDTIQLYKEDINKQIKELIPTQSQKISVKHELLMTMIDGKVSSHISGTSSAVCDICHAKPTEMNDLDKLECKYKNDDMYQYGLSSLHAWIRCMECLLHIGYRMDFKKWSCRGEDKEKLAQRKEIIQKSFKCESGLLIDVVKQGAGTTNDGNTARRFFGDSSTSARILGVDENLIERLHVILQAVASGERVNVKKFSQFCKETAILYIQLYPWYYMPSSVHKLLVHGADIIEYFGVMPIGKLSEEASEARNKDFRKFREHHSRKINRVATNEDILHHFLLSSDPKLSFIKPRMAKQGKSILSPKAIELLIPLPNESELEFIDVDKSQDSDSDD